MRKTLRCSTCLGELPARRTVYCGWVCKQNAKLYRRYQRGGRYAFVFRVKVDSSDISRAVVADDWSVADVA